MAEETSEESTSATKRSRKSNWGARDEIILVEEVQKREQLLFGKLAGPGRTVLDKAKAWQEVTDLVNAGNPSSKRNISEIKKKFQNIKQKAKEKRSEAIRPKTGGGKRPPSPSASEQLLLNNYEGRPSMCGLSSGIDTAEPLGDISSLFLIIPNEQPTDPTQPSDSTHHEHTVSIQPTTSTQHTTSTQPTTATQHPTSTQLTTATQPTASTHLTEPSTRTSSSPSPTVTPEMLLREELVNIRERRKLIKDQQQLVHLQKYHLLLKIRQRDPFFDVEHFMSEI